MTNKKMNGMEKFANELSDENLQKVIGGLAVTAEVAEEVSLLLEERDAESEEVVGKRGPNPRIIKR